MIPAMGIIVGLYVTTRYVEMFKSRGTVGKIILIILILITLGSMTSFMGSEIAQVH